MCLLVQKRDSRFRERREDWLRKMRLLVRKRDSRLREKMEDLRREMRLALLERALLRERCR